MPNTTFIKTKDAIEKIIAISERIDFTPLKYVKVKRAEDIIGQIFLPNSRIYYSSRKWFSIKKKDDNILLDDAVFGMCKAIIRYLINYERTYIFIEDSLDNFYYYCSENYRNQKIDSQLLAKDKTKIEECLRYTKYSIKESDIIYWNDSQEILQKSLNSFINNIESLLSEFKDITLALYLHVISITEKRNNII